MDDDFTIEGETARVRAEIGAIDVLIAELERSNERTAAGRRISELAIARQQLVDELRQLSSPF